MTINKCYFIDASDIKKIEVNEGAVTQIKMKRKGVFGHRSGNPKRYDRKWEVSEFESKNDESQ